MREKNVSRPANEIKGSNRPITFLSLLSTPKGNTTSAEWEKKMGERELAGLQTYCRGYRDRRTIPPKHTRNE